ncbi:MAG: OmpA family protein [Saprospiraceae bacterium]|nr:OmpA family protein [Saprospiraceae bacterium]
MASPLIKRITEGLGSERLASLARQLDVEPSSIGQRLQEALAATLLLASGKASTEAGARGLMDFTVAHEHQLADVDDPAGASFSAGSADQLQLAGAEWMRYLAGDQLAALTDLLAKRLSISPAAGSGLLKISAPLLISMLHSEVDLTSGPPSQIKAFLLGECNALDQDLVDQYSATAGLILPASEVAGSDQNEGDARITLDYMPEEQPLASKLLPWIVLLLTSLALLYFVGRGCSSSPAASDDQQISSVRMVNLDLPDGEEIATPSGSCIAQLFEAMRQPGVHLTTPFTLDSVTFAPGSAALNTASLSEIDQLLALLRAFPHVQIRLEGHTDNSGNARNNLELSTRQAEAIKTYLSARGIDRSRIRAIGRGQTKPVASNSSEQGMAANRRIEIYLTESVR